MQENLGRCMISVGCLWSCSILEAFVKLFKENPLLLIWLLVLTALVIFSLYHVKVTINLQMPEHAKASVRPPCSNTEAHG